MTAEAINPFAAIPGPVDYGTWEFKAARHILLELCEQAVAVVAREGQRPDLASFQVRVGGPDTYLRVAGTDTDRTVIALTQAVTFSGDLSEAYIPARWLLAVLKEAAGSDVTVKVDKNNATVSSGDTSWSRQLPDSSAYPSLPAPSALDFAACSREGLLEALQSVRHAVCKDSSLANLTQVVISREQDSTEAWATASDGSRLARAAIPGFPAAFSIPATALDTLMRLLGMKGTECAVAQTDKLVAFRSGHVTYTAVKRMVPFPSVDGLLKAANNDEVLTVDRSQLEGAVRRIRISADADTSAMALRLGAEEITVTARDDSGNATEEVPASWKGTPGRLVVVRHGDLSEAMAAHPEPSCEFRLGKDVGKRLSKVYLAGGGVVQVLTQLPAELVGL